MHYCEFVHPQPGTQVQQTFTAFGVCLPDTRPLRGVMRKQGQQPIQGMTLMHGDRWVILFRDVPPGAGYCLEVTNRNGEVFGVIGLTVIRHDGKKGFDIDFPTPSATTGSHMLFSATGPSNLASGSLYSATLQYNTLEKTFDHPSFNSVFNHQWSVSFSMTDADCTGNQSVTLEVVEVQNGQPKTVTFTLTN